MYPKLPINEPEFNPLDNPLDNLTTPNQNPYIIAIEGLNIAGATTAIIGQTTLIPEIGELNIYELDKLLENLINPPLE